MRDFQRWRVLPIGIEAMYHMDAVPLGILHIMQLFLPLHRSPSTSAMNDVSTPRSSESEMLEWCPCCV
ncbi:hypothetical protein AZE42_10245 [Rhizopogon vesiculosus]|uniref:Uncharacterized protein n=1 Tax=Rhizopogon vesiculosus TaxID=180088 RepID=A0A1J8PX44_9AGAM|nr:hypothetical protein AZE42_10245 [Rhizopogon vesiculosus]